MRKPQWYIDRRITTIEGEYPYCDANFFSAEDYAEFLEKEIVAARAEHRRVGDLYERERERAERVEVENVKLREMLTLVMSIPNMTDDQLATLIANAKAALREGGKCK